MRLQDLLVFAAIGLASPLWAADESRGAAPNAAATRQAAGPEASIPPTNVAVAGAVEVTSLDPLENTRLTARPIARFKRFEPSSLPSMAGPAFLVGWWQQQLFYQRSIDPRNPYYGTGLTR